jgi:hypothetical protein
VTLRIVVVTHRSFAQTGYIAPYLVAMRDRFDVSFVYTEDGWPTSASLLPREGVDACVWFVRFRELARQPPFDWTGFRGLRIMHDHDAYLSYGAMDGVSEHLGAWGPVFRRHRFDLLLASGKEVTNRLRAEALNAHWLPKGFDPHQFFDFGRERTGIGTYGSPYLARRIVLSQLERHGEAVTRFSCRFDRLNETLNKFAACVICNMFTHWRLPPLDAGSHVGRAVTRIAPQLAFRLHPGMEPMIKNFEAPGAGCAPIADRIPELEDLGFTDGVSLISYRDVNELVEKLRHYRDRPDELRAIGASAAGVCHERHTWDVRTAEMEKIIRSTLA